LSADDGQRARKIVVDQFEPLGKHYALARLLAHDRTVGSFSRGRKALPRQGPLSVNVDCWRPAARIAPADS
jgi:hypothetical protein